MIIKNLITHSVIAEVRRPLHVFNPTISLDASMVPHLSCGHFPFKPSYKLFEFTWGIEVRCDLLAENCVSHGPCGVGPPMRVGAERTIFCESQSEFRKFPWSERIRSQKIPVRKKVDQQSSITLHDHNNPHELYETRSVIR